MIAPYGDTTWDSTSRLEFLPERGLIVGGKLTDGRGAVAFAESISVNPRAQRVFDTAVTDVAVTEKGFCVAATEQGAIHAWHIGDSEDTWQRDFDSGLFTEHTESWEKIRLSVGAGLVALGRTRGEKAEVWDLMTGEHRFSRRAVGLNRMS